MDDASLVVNSKLFRDKNNPINKINGRGVGGVHLSQTAHAALAGQGPRASCPTRCILSTRRRCVGLIQQRRRHAEQPYAEFRCVCEFDIAYRSKSASGGRAQRGDYPTAEQFRERMGFDMRFTPMPEARHFLFDLTDEDQAKFDEAMVQTANAASNDVVLRMLEP